MKKEELPSKNEEMASSRYQQPSFWRLCQKRVGNWRWISIISLWEKVKKYILSNIIIVSSQRRYINDAFVKRVWIASKRKFMWALYSPNRKKSHLRSLSCRDSFYVQHVSLSIIYGLFHGLVVSLHSVPFFLIFPPFSSVQQRKVNLQNLQKLTNHVFIWT